MWLEIMNFMVICVVSFFLQSTLKCLGLLWQLAGVWGSHLAQMLQVVNQYFRLLSLETMPVSHLGLSILKHCPKGPRTQIQGIYPKPELPLPNTENIDTPCFGTLDA